MPFSRYVFGELNLKLTTTVAKGIRVYYSSKFQRQLREEEGLRLCGHVRHCHSIGAHSSSRQARVPIGSVSSKILLIPPFLISSAMGLNSLKQGRNDADSIRSHSV
jgi:hypothetical protein